VKRIYSLKGRNLIREVYQKGRKFQDVGIRVFIFKCDVDKYVKPDRRKHSSPGGKKIKIAVALAKSYGKAHIRNRAKRRIRAICTELLNELRDGFCIIIKIENAFKNIQFDEEKRIMRSLFAKAGLLISDADPKLR
jgi:ribonuclease P protein component